MKQTKTVIAKKDREMMSKDVKYQTCSLYGQHGHECGGKVTWEHTLIFAGKKLQSPWSIIPLCEKGHAVNNYQDAGTMVKEMNVWVALNQASEDDLRMISKAIDYLHMKNYLNGKYGVYIRQYPVKYALASNTQKSETKKEPIKKFWYPASDEEKEMIRECIEFHKEIDEMHFTPFQMISEMIRKYHQDIIDLKKDN